MGPLGLPTVTWRGRPSSGFRFLILNSICWDQNRAPFHCQQMSLSDISGTIKAVMGRKSLIWITAKEINCWEGDHARLWHDRCLYTVITPHTHKNIALSPSSKQNLHNSFQFSLCFPEGSCNWIFLQVATISQAALTWNEMRPVKLHWETASQSRFLPCTTFIQQQILDCGCSSLTLTGTAPGYSE